MPPPIPARDPAAWLDITGDEPMTVTVYPMGDRAERDRPLFSCRTPCRVRIYPGRYRFHVRGGADKIEADRVVDVRGSERLSFSLPDRGSKSGALATAITGTVLVPLGLLVAVASSWCMECEEPRKTPPGVYVGMGMFVVGAIMTPIGWVQFAQNRKPRVEEAPFGSASGRAPTARAKTKPESSGVASRIGFGFAPTRGGASAGVWGSF